VDFDLARHMLEKSYQSEFIESNRDYINMYATETPERPKEDTDVTNDLFKNNKYVKETPQSELSGGGGNGRSGGIGGSGGGGDGNSEGGSNEEPKSRRISAEEKYGAKGLFAKEVLLNRLPTSEIELMIESPMKEMRYIWTVRSHLDDPDFPFKAAFDLHTNKVHYFVPREAVMVLIDSEYKDLTNESVSDQESDNVSKVFLNQDHGYVKDNFILENDEEEMNSNSSMAEAVGTDYIFVPIEVVSNYVGNLMQIDSKS